jgi:hypothetical protein
MGPSEVDPVGGTAGIELETHAWVLLCYLSAVWLGNQGLISLGLRVKCG